MEASRFRWESGTAFGAAVVPEVKRIKAIFCGEAVII
jgi:hypothetical protein